MNLFRPSPAAEKNLTMEEPARFLPRSESTGERLVGDRRNTDSAAAQGQGERVSHAPNRCSGRGPTRADLAKAGSRAIGHNRTDSVTPSDKISSASCNTVRIEPAAFPRHDKLNGKRFAEAVEAEFTNLKLELGQKK